MLKSQSKAKYLWELYLKNIDSAYNNNCFININCGYLKEQIISTLSHSLLPYL